MNELGSEMGELGSGMGELGSGAGEMGSGVSEELSQTPRPWLLRSSQCIVRPWRFIPTLTLTSSSAPLGFASLSRPRIVGLMGERTLAVDLNNRQYSHSFICAHKLSI